MNEPGVLTPLPAPSLLFCPADRPERYSKALAAADVVVIDLEDAVSPPSRPRARDALVSSDLDPARVIVRVNSVPSVDYRDDIAALARTRYRYVMLAKTEGADQIRTLSRWQVVALCETPLGVLEAPAIAAEPNIVALMWGAEDLVAAMAGRSSRGGDGAYRGVARHARSSVLLAAKAYQRQAIDAVYADFADLAGLEAETRDAAESGFDLKACIHPRQAGVVRDCYRPADAQIAWARRVLDAARAGGVTSIDGKMVDAPLLTQAKRTLAWGQQAGRDL
jgi:citrate lyase subunit beta / citryl-CoA lyase